MMPARATFSATDTNPVITKIHHVHIQTYETMCSNWGRNTHTHTHKGQTHTDEEECEEGKPSL